jgi:hypothetical protein
LENNACIHSLKILLDIYLLLDLVYTSSALDERGSYCQVWVALVADLVAALVVTGVVLDKQTYSGYCCNSEMLLLIVGMMNYCYY